MNRRKVFSYITENNYTNLDNTVKELKKTHNKASKSKIIELGLIELFKNNNFESIQNKLRINYMDF